MHRALGDSVFGLSALSYLRTVFPNTKVTYALPRWVTPLYQECQIPADKVFPLELESLKGMGAFMWEIRKEKYDVVIELQQSGRTRKILNFCKHFLGFEYAFHNHHLKTGGDVFEQGVRKAITQRHLDTCYSFVRKKNPQALYPHYLDFLPKIDCPSVRPAPDQNQVQVVLGVVASKEEKKWPVDHYVQLAKLWAKKHPHLKFLAPLSHSEEDQKLAQELREKAQGLNLEIVSLPLNELVKKMSGTQIYLGNDTGLKHIAIALGAKSVSFFGPEEPLEWHPYPLDRHPYFWVHGLDARDQMREICLLKQFESDVLLSEISVDVVAQSLEKLGFL